MTILLSASTLLPIIGGVALFAFAMLSIKLTIDAYFDVLANYEAACKGDPEAIQSIVADTMTSLHLC